MTTTMTHGSNVCNASNLMYVGEIERAEVNFKAVHNSANGSKKEYLFGALVGLVRTEQLSNH
jgi:hypothetical protein